MNDVQALTSGMRMFLVLYLIVMNLTAFLMYGRDKEKAKKRQWRTPEAVLLMMAAAGGPLGAFLGMQIFRHKTKHLKFMIFVPLCLILWTYLIIRIY